MRLAGEGVINARRAFIDVSALDGRGHTHEEWQDECGSEKHFHVGNIPLFRMRVATNAVEDFQKSFDSSTANIFRSTSGFGGELSDEESNADNNSPKDEYPLPGYRQSPFPGMRFGSPANAPSADQPPAVDGLLSVLFVEHESEQSVLRAMSSRTLIAAGSRAHSEPDVQAFQLRSGQRKVSPREVFT